MVVGTLRGIGDEFVGLLTRAGSAWWRLAPWLVALGLIGWVGHYGAVLIGTELTFFSPWLVILGLAIGAVVQLGTIVIALRLVMERIGVGLGSVATVESQPSSPLRLVAQTILPFLAIYAAFGYVDNYARNVLFAMSGRYGWGSAEFLMELDPTRSPEVLATVAGVVVVLYLARRGLDWIARRRESIWVGLVGAVLEASWLLVLLLSVFRLVQQAQLWLNSRQLAAWWDGLLDLLFGWIELTGFWLTAWEFVSSHAWPALWDVLAQPLAWLALAAMVAGIRVATSAELLEQSEHQRTANLAKLANGFFAGDLDDKIAPLWQAVRFLTRAGLPLLGGYVLAFTAVDLVGDLVTAGVDQLIGPQLRRDALRVMPFYDLIELVVVMSLRLALLSVTVKRVGEAMAAESEPRGHRVVEGITVALVCLALAMSSLAIQPSTGTWERAGELNTGLELLGATVTVGDPHAGLELVEQRGDVRPTDLAFLVIPVTVFTERGTVLVTAELRAGERSYEQWDSVSLMGTDPGFATQRDLVFEVDPADLAAELVLELHPSAPLQLGELIGQVVLPPLTIEPQVSYDDSQRQWVP